MSNEHNIYIYKLLNTLLLQSDIEDMNTNDKLDLMNETYKEINSRNTTEILPNHCNLWTARGRYNERIDDIIKLIN